MQDARHHLRRAVVAEDVVDASVGFDGDLLFENEFTMHAPRAATVQGLIEQRHRAPIGGAPFGNCIADGHGRQRSEFFFHFSAALFLLFRLDQDRQMAAARRQECRRNISAPMQMPSSAFTSPSISRTALFGT